MSVWGRTQVRSEIKSKVHHASPAIGPEYVVPYLGRIKPRYTRVGLLCLIFNRVCPFLTNQRPSIVPPCARMAWFGDPLHSSHPTPRHTSNTRICLHASAEIHTYDTWMPICTMATCGRASAVSGIDVGSICPTKTELRAAAAKQAGTCVGRVALGGMWRVEGSPRTSAFI